MTPPIPQAEASALCCYRVDYFGPSHFVKSERIDADSDGEAINRARPRKGMHAVEIWCGPRKVQVLPAIELPLLSPPAPPASRAA